jgi:hypothetical protein
VHRIGFPVSASQEHSRANLPAGIDAVISEVVRAADFCATVPADRRPRVAVGIAMAFGCSDAALAGLSGCPLAPGASGNAATEDVAFMFESVEPGIDLDLLMRARQYLAKCLPDEPLHGHCAAAGRPAGSSHASLA